MARVPDGFRPFWLQRLKSIERFRLEREAMRALGMSVMSPAEAIAHGAKRPLAPVIPMISEPAVDMVNKVAMSTTRVFPRSIAGEHAELNGRVIDEVPQ